MPDTLEDVQKVEILFAVEGHGRHFGVHVGPNVTVGEFLAAAAADVGAVELVEVFAEDSDEPLAHSLLLFEQLPASFAPLHVATCGTIKTTVEYNNRKVQREFRPSATIARIIKWAIGPEGLNLEGKPADYQIKHDGKIVPPTTHLGQISQGEKAVRLHLVFKVKPQGASDVAW